MKLYYDTTFDGLRVQKFEVGTMENNIYVLSDTASGEAYIIDSGYEPAEIARRAEGLTVRGVLVTHGHRDHHEHVAELKDLLGVPIGIGIDDASMLSVTADELIVDQ